MAPVKNKKKLSAASKSTSKHVDSGKKPLKKGKRTVIASESASEVVVSDEKIMEVPTPKVKKPCTWLKLDRVDPQIGSKPSLQSSKQDKEAKSPTQVQALEDNKRKRNEKGREKVHYNPSTHEKQNDSLLEKKEVEIVNDKHEGTKKRYEASGENLGGLIFMCNAKTKPDCFKYKVMGVSANKKEVVMSIKPGLKIFLYDYDLKLMYGVFEASSAGGMKLEPAAFGGAFPAQVRFIVHKDCIPLPERVFKKAIKDSYDERTHKFKTELTVKQVRHLIDLFTPAPWLRPNGKSAVEEPTTCPVPPATLLSEESLMRHRYLNEHVNSDTRGRSIPLHYEDKFSDFRNTIPPQDSLFLTEQEYRSNGLRQGRHLLPTTAGGNGSQTWEPNKLDLELKQLLRNPASTSNDSAVQQREISKRDPFSLSEKEYRIYGLRGPQQTLNAASPMLTTNAVVRDPGRDACNPYDESTTLLVNRYLAVPMTKAVPAEPYPPAGRDPYVNDLNHTSDMKSHPASTVPDGERAFASYNLREQSVINQRSYSLNASGEPSVFSQGTTLQRETNLISAPVSHRYSFGGPYLSKPR